MILTNVKTDIRHVVSGDHNAVTIVIKVVTRNGPGFWKLNTSLLTKTYYCNNVRKIIDETIKEKTLAFLGERHGNYVILGLGNTLFIILGIGKAKKIKQYKKNYTIWMKKCGSLMVRKCKKL